MAKTKVVSFRISIEDLAKGLDTILAKGIPISEVTTISQIIKICFYYGIIAYNKDTKLPPSEESINFIKQKFDQTKTSKGITMSELEEIKEELK